MNWIATAVTVTIALLSDGEIRQDQGTGDFNGFGNLTLGLETHATGLIASQALYVIVHLRNETRSTIKTKVALTELGNHLRLYAAFEKEEFRRYRRVGLDDCCFFPIPERSFAPGEEDAIQVVLSACKEGPVFARSGRYRVKSELAGGNAQMIVSPEIQITVSEPTGNDVLAEAFLKQKDLIRTFGSGGSGGRPDPSSELKEFLSRYGDTAYAWQVRLALATILRNGLPTSWRGDPPDVKQRLSDTWAVLEGSFSHCPPEILPDVLYLAIETKCFQGDRAKAEELLSTFKEKCSWHPRYAELEDLKESVERIKPEKDK